MDLRGETSRSQKAALSPLWALPPRRATKWWSFLPQPGDYLRLHPTWFTGAFYRESKASLPKAQGCCQIEKTKKCGPSERTEQTPEKELNRTEITYQMQNSKHWWSVCLKTSMSTVKTREEMKVTLSEIKSTGNQQWKGGSRESSQQFGTQRRKKHSVRTARRKNNSEKMRTGLGTSGTTLNVPTCES